MNPDKFKSLIWEYYRTSGRSFAWRKNITPYKIIVSEVMLQQTQVERVEKKFTSFIARFPDFQSLARSSQTSVLKEWQGLGYNRRALSLHALSKIVMKEFSGKLPRDPKLLEKLPGIGEATAGAICAFAFNIPVEFIETNIRRVYLYCFFPNKEKVSDDEILPIVRRTLEFQRPREWYWALMDYGAMLGKTIQNPNRQSAHYQPQPSFEGSRRKLRGMILKSFLEKNFNKKDFREYEESLIKSVVEDLIEEGFMSKKTGEKFLS